MSGEKGMPVDRFYRGQKIQGLRNPLNQLADAINSDEVIGDGIIQVKRVGRKVAIGFSWEQFWQRFAWQAVNMTPVKCTVEDTPSAGLHTFAEVDADGVAVSGGKTFASCRLLGDFSKAWDITTDTFGLAFTYGNQNYVLIVSNAANAYYYE